jgi:hypothetical protein
VQSNRDQRRPSSSIIGFVPGQCTLRQLPGNARCSSVEVCTNATSADCIDFRRDRQRCERECDKWTTSLPPLGRGSSYGNWRIIQCCK